MPEAAKKVPVYWIAGLPEHARRTNPRMAAASKINMKTPRCFALSAAYAAPIVNKHATELLLVRFEIREEWNWAHTGIRRDGHQLRFFGRVCHILDNAAGS